MNNTVILIGNITRNIELRTLLSGKNTCNVTLAVKRNYKNSQNIYESDFINCKAFGNTAELISKYCKKGDTIGIKGNILTGSYEKDEKKVYTQDIVIQEISFLKQAQENKKEGALDKAVNEFKEEIELSNDMLPF